FTSILGKIFILVVFFAKLSSAYAVVGGMEKCIFDIGEKGTINIQPQLPLIPNDAAVGAVLFKQDYLYDTVSYHQAVRCGDDSHFSFNFVTEMTGSSSFGNNVFDTNIEGVGLRLSMYSAQSYYAFPTTPTFSPFSIPIVFDSDDYRASFGTGYLHIIVELIKTSNYIGSGTLNYRAGNYFYAQGENNLLLSDLNISASIETEASCKFSDSTPKSIELGDVDANLLENPGSTANIKDFSVGLNCLTPANVNLFFSGVSDPAASEGGVLKIDNSSTAKGVGIQLLHDGKPIEINGKLPLGQVNTGLSAAHLQARVYRTSETLKAGPFSAVTTISIVYQ
ncbi:TPA: fimbrial protein, partial [Enterobacter asburiae]|nr:fimbrial protein [Enterobacter asburiae]